MTVIASLPAQPRPDDEPLLRLTLDRLCGGVVLVAVEGELDLYTRSVLADLFASDAAYDADLLVLDLRRLRFADAAGLRPVLQECGRRQDGVLLLEPPARVAQVLAALGLHRRLIRWEELPDDVVEE